MKPGRENKLKIKCSKCGAVLKRRELFCSKCGTPIPHDEENITEGNTACKTRPAKKIIIAAVCSAIVIVVGIILIIMLSGKPYETPVKNTLDGIINNEPSLYIDSMPDFIRSNSNLSFTKKLVTNLNKNLYDEYGHDAKFTYDVKDSQKLNKGELEDIISDIYDYYGEAVRITDGYYVRVKTVSTGTKKEGITNMKFTVIKTGGEWKLFTWEDISGDPFFII